MSDEDSLLIRLGRLARDSERDELERGLTGLARGELRPEQLRDRAGDEEILAYTPVSDAVRASIVADARAQLRTRPVRRIAPVVAMLASAAAVLLFAWRGMTPELPRYGLEVEGAPVQLRGSRELAEHGVTIAPDTELRLLLRPETTFGGKVEARVVALVRGGREVVWPAVSQVSGEGAVRLQLAAPPMAVHTLRAVVVELRAPGVPGQRFELPLRERP